MSITNERFQIQNYPSPLASDVLFYELRDRILPKNKQPAYGEPHPNSVLWPHHVLVFIQSAPRDSGGKQMWWYAAKRENQDLYNWTHSEADIGGVRFDSVSREYVVPRSEFDPDSPAQGSAMVDVPSGQFSGTHILAERSLVQAPTQEIASIFSLERRTYVKKVPFADVEINRETGTAKSIITTLYYRGEIVEGSSTIESLATDPEDAFWELDENGYGNVCKQLSDNWWEVTQRQWIDIQDVYEWEEDRLGPDRFYCPIGIATTTITTTDGTVGPIDEGSLPSVADGQRVKIVKWGRILKVSTSERIGEPQSLGGEEYGDIVTRSVSEELVAKDAEADTGIDVISSVVQAIDGCNTVKTTKEAKGGWPDPVNEKATKSRDNLIPQKFQAFLKRVLRTKKVLAVPDEIVLTGDEVVREYERETPDRVEERITTEAIDESAEPLVGSVLLGDGTVGTVTESLIETGGAEDALVPDALLVDANIDPLGNGKSVKKTVIIPEVFDAKALSVEKPDLVPTKFRGAVPSETTQETVAGNSVSMPTLGASEVSKSEQRVSAFTKRVATTTRDATSLPVSLTETLIDNDGIVVTRIQTLAATDQSVTPSATVSGQVEALGDDLTLKTEDTKAGVFDAMAVTKSILDLTPQKFRTSAEITETDETVSGTSASPTLDSSEESRTEQRIDAFRIRRTSKKHRKPTLPTDIVESSTNADGQVVTITSTLKAAGGPAAVPSATIVKVQTDKLGDGRMVETKEEIPEVFSGIAHSKTRPDAVPQAFRVEIPETAREETVAGTAAEPTLGPTDLSRSEQQVTKFVKRTSERTRPEEALPSSLTETLVDSDGILVTRVKTLDASSQSISPSATVSGEVEALGGNLTLKIEDTKASVFDALALSHEQAVGVPAKFVTKEETESETVAATSPTLPNLGDGGAGVVSASAQRVDAFRVNTRQTTRTLVGSVPGSQLFQNFGGGVATVEESLVDDSTAAEGGFNVLSATVNAIGGGKAVMEKVTASEAFPLLEGQKYDADYGVDVPFTERVVAAGTSAEESDIEPIDQWRSRVKTVDYEAYRNSLLDVHVVLPGEDTVQLPDTLTSVEVLVSRAQAVSNAYGNGRGFNLQTGGSVTVAADLSYVIEEGFAGTVPAETHIFFLPQDGADPSGAIKAKCNAESLPQYRPTQKRLVISGRSATQRFAFSSSDDGGSGSESSDVSAFTNVATIPSTLNESITPSITYSDFTADTGVFDVIRDQALTSWRERADAIRELVENAPEGTDPFVLDYLRTYLDGLDETLDIASDQDIADFPVQVAPAIIPATTPTSVETGRFITKSNAQLYGFGLVKITAIVAIIE